MPGGTAPGLDPLDVVLDEEQEKLLVDTFADELEAQLRARSWLEDNWARYLEIYSGEPEVTRKTWPWEGASNLVINLAKIYVDQVVARIMQGIFQNEPHWIAEQVNRKDSGVVKPIERFLDWTRQHAWKQKKVVKPFVLECAKLGTGVLYNGWRDEPYFTFNRETGTMEETGRFIGPAPCWVPREDFLHPQGFNDVQTMPWLGYRQWYTMQELRALEAQGVFMHVDDLAGHEDTESELRKIRQSMQDDSRPSRVDEFALYSPWQVWFNWDLDGDGTPEPYTMMIHLGARKLLRIRRNSYTRGMRPFIVAPFIEIEGQLDGCGIPQSVEYYQAEATTIHNQKVDNGTLANAPVFEAMRGAGYTERLAFRPGKIFLSSMMGGIKPLVINSNYQRAITDEQAVIQLAERAVGLSDPNLGQISSPVGRAAATTMMMAMQEGTRRHDFNTTEIRDALSEQGLQILELYQEHGLPEPSDPWSPEQVLDDKDAVMVRQILGTPGYLRAMVALKLNVATQALNKEIQKQSDMQLLGILQQYFMGIKGELTQTLPLLAQAPPQVAKMVIRMAQGVDRMMVRVFQDNGAFDLEEVLVGDLLSEMIEGVMGGANGQGLPGNVAAAPSPFAGPSLGGGGAFPGGGVPGPALQIGNGSAGGPPAA